MSARNLFLIKLFKEEDVRYIYNQLYEYLADDTYFYNDLLLYDFANINNPEQKWKGKTYSDVNAGKITIDGVERNWYAIGNNGEEGYIIEGIGYDGYGCHMNAGDLMCQFPALVTGTDKLPIFNSFKNAEGKTIYSTGDAANAFNGVESIEADSNAPIEYYNLHGIKIANPQSGIFIKKQGNRVSKVIVE